MNIRLLMDLREHLTVVDHIPGKIKVKFALAALTHPAVQEISNSGAKPPAGILNTKFNVFSRTIEVMYETKLIPFDTLGALFNEQDQSRLQNMVGELEAQLG